jgi:hypothetical protein
MPLIMMLPADYMTIPIASGIMANYAFLILMMPIIDIIEFFKYHIDLFCIACKDNLALKRRIGSI